MNTTYVQGLPVILFRKFIDIYMNSLKANIKSAA